MLDNNLSGSSLTAPELKSCTCGVTAKSGSQCMLCKSFYHKKCRKPDTCCGTKLTSKPSTSTDVFDVDQEIGMESQVKELIIQLKANNVLINKLTDKICLMEVEIKQLKINKCKHCDVGNPTYTTYLASKTPRAEISCTDIAVGSGTNTPTDISGDGLTKSSESHLQKNTIDNSIHTQAMISKTNANLNNEFNDSFTNGTNEKKSYASAVADNKTTNINKDFKTIKPKINNRFKKSVIIGNGNNKAKHSSFLGTERRQWVHVYRVEPGTAEDTVCNYVRELINTDDVKCHRLTDSEDICSFKVGVKESIIKKLLIPDVWPLGVAVREFIPFKKTKGNFRTEKNQSPNS